MPAVGLPCGRGSCAIRFDDFVQLHGVAVRSVRSLLLFGDGTIIQSRLPFGKTVGWLLWCWLIGLLLFVLFVRLGLGNDVCKELQVLDTSDCVCWAPISMRSRLDGPGWI